MSFVGNFISCPNLQDQLIGHFGELSDEIQEPSPFLEFLTSPMNTSGVLQNQIDTKNGHKRTVELIYRNRHVESDVSDSAVLDCNGGDARGETSQTYQIDETTGSSIAWSVTPSQLQDRCEDDALYVAREVMAKMDVLKRKMNTDAWTKAATLFGNFSTTHSSSPVEVATLNSASAYVPDALDTIAYEFRRMKWFKTVALFGGSKTFETYFKNMAAMCCNTTLGIDIAELFRGSPVVPFFDYKAETTLGTNQFLAMAPGALQLITYNEFKGPRGIRVIDTENYVQGILTDPFTGIEFDYFAQIVCGKWNFQLKVAHDLVGLPNDMFALDDTEVVGVTWVNNFKIVNP